MSLLGRESPSLARYRSPRVRDGGGAAPRAEVAAAAGCDRLLGSDRSSPLPRGLRCCGAGPAPGKVTAASVAPGAPPVKVTQGSGSREPCRGRGCAAPPPTALFGQGGACGLCGGWALSPVPKSVLSWWCRGGCWAWAAFPAVGSLLAWWGNNECSHPRDLCCPHGGGCGYWASAPSYF